MFGGCMDRMKCSTRFLSLSSLVVGLVSAGALSLAVATDFWLYTRELVVMPPTSDSTGSPVGPGGPGPDGPGGPGGGPDGPDMMDVGMNNTDYYGGDYGFDPMMMGPMIVPIHMHSGLWRMCIYYKDLPEPSTCTNIGYFSQEWQRVSETDTTNSILRAIRKSSPVIVFSLLLLLVSLAISTVGSSKRNSQTIIGAVIYILSALSLAIGVIFYISAVNDEVSHRKKPSTSDESFHYNYGWAFFFAGSSFLSSMMAAVTNVSLYLRRYPNLEDMVLIIPGLDKHSRLDAKSGEDVDYCEPHPGSQNPTIIL